MHFDKAVDGRLKINDRSEDAKFGANCLVWPTRNCIKKTRWTFLSIPLCDPYGSVLSNGIDYSTAVSSELILLKTSAIWPPRVATAAMVTTAINPTRIPYSTSAAALVFLTSFFMKISPVLFGLVFLREALVLLRFALGFCLPLRTKREIDTSI